MSKIYSHIILAAAIAATSINSFANEQWKITDIGGPQNATSLTILSDINNNSKIVGTANGDYEIAFSWNSGNFNSLGMQPDRRYQSRATGINNSGQIVGTAFISKSPDSQYYPNAVIWDDGGMRSLGALIGGRESYANAINENGIVVGFGETFQYPGYQYHATAWSAGTISDLGTLPGGNTSRAISINKSGKIVGQSTAGYDFNRVEHATIWDNQLIIDLEDDKSSSNVYGSSAQDINDNDIVVGTSNRQAAIWNARVKSYLPSLDITTGSAALSINNKNAIVGYSAGRAVIWEQGRITDLNSFDGVSGSGWNLISANGINENGEIIGMGTNPQGFYQGFYLTPLPEPKTFATMLAGLIFIIVIKRVAKDI